MEIVLILGVILIVGAGIFIFVISKGEDKNKKSSPQMTTPTPASPPAPDASPMLRILEETKTQLQNPLPVQVNTERWIYITHRPFGIKFITFFNWISIVLNVLSVILVVCFFPVVVKMLQEQDADFLAMGVPTSLIVVAGALAGLWTFFLFMINQGLWNFRGWARVVQSIFSIPGLFMFPVGTVISLIYLYFLILDPGVSIAFQKQKGSLY